MFLTVRQYLEVLAFPSASVSGGMQRRRSVSRGKVAPFVVSRSSIIRLDSKSSTGVVLRSMSKSVHVGPRIDPLRLL